LFLKIEFGERQQFRHLDGIDLTSARDRFPCAMNNNFKKLSFPSEGREERGTSGEAKQEQEWHGSI
jgi:hypothetical protein